MNRPWVTHARTRLAPRARGSRRTHQCATGADEIVDDDAGGAGHVAHEQIARNHPGAAMFFGKRLADRTAHRRFQCVPQEIRPLSASQIRRDDAKRLVADGDLDRIDQQWRRCQRHGAAAKRIFEGCFVVHFERHHGIGADCFEKRRDIARRHRIVRLGAAVLSRIAEIGRDGGHAPGAGVFQGSDKEQKSAELVIGALLWIPVKAMNHVDVGPGNGISATTAPVFLSQARSTGVKPPSPPKSSVLVTSSPVPIVCAPVFGISTP